MAFPENLACLVVDDNASNRASSFFVYFLCQQNGEAHEIRIASFLEKCVPSNRGQALCRKMCDNVEHLIGHGRFVGEQRFCHGLTLSMEAPGPIGPARQHHWRYISISLIEPKKGEWTT